MPLLTVRIPPERIAVGGQVENIAKIIAKDIDNDNLEEFVFLVVKETGNKKVSDISIAEYSGNKEKIFCEVSNSPILTFDVLSPGILVGIGKNRRRIFVEPFDVTIGRGLVPGLSVEDKEELRTRTNTIDYEEHDFFERFYTLLCSDYWKYDEGLFLLSNAGIHFYRYQKILEGLKKKLVVLGYGNHDMFVGLTPKALSRLEGAPPKRIRVRPVAADFDGDGFKELAVFVWGENLIEVYGAEFKKIEVLRIPEHVLGMTSWDFNGDGAYELIVYLGGSNPRIVVYEYSPNGFNPIYNIALPKNCSVAQVSAPIVVGDINGDGSPEFIVACGENKDILLILDIKGNILASKRFSAPINSIRLGKFDSSPYPTIAIGSDTLYLGSFLDDSKYKKLVGILKNMDLALSLLVVFKPKFAQSVRNVVRYDKTIFDAFLKELERNPAMAIYNLFLAVAPNTLDKDTTLFLLSFLGRYLVLAYSTPYVPALIWDVPLELLPLDLLDPNLIPREKFGEILRLADPVRHPRFFLSMKLDDQKLLSLGHTLLEAWGSEFARKLASLIDHSTLMNIARLTKLLGMPLLENIIKTRIKEFIDKEGVVKEELVELYKLGFADMEESDLLELLERDPTILSRAIDTNPEIFVKYADQLDDKTIKYFIDNVRDKNLLKALVAKLGPERTIIFLDYLPSDVIPKDYWDYYLKKYPQLIGDKAPPEHRVFAGLKTGNIKLIFSGLKEKTDLIRTLRDSLPPKVLVVLYLRGLIELSRSELDKAWADIASSQKALIFLANRNPEYFREKMLNGEIDDVIMFKILPYIPLNLAREFLAGKPIEDILLYINSVPFQALSPHHFDALLRIKPSLLLGRKGTPPDYAAKAAVILGRSDVLLQLLPQIEDIIHEIVLLASDTNPKILIPLLSTKVKNLAVLGLLRALINQKIDLNTLRSELASKKMLGLLELLDLGGVLGLAYYIKDAGLSKDLLDMFLGHQIELFQGFLDETLPTLGKANAIIRGSLKITFRRRGRSRKLFAEFPYNQ